jgi:hypothetical protein
VSATQGRQACKAGRGPRQAPGKIGFSVISFTDYSFYSNFEQISHSFLCSNYSNEYLFRESKSNRNFSEKFKVNGFI